MYASENTAFEKGRLHENIAIEKGRVQKCEAMWLQCISVTGTMGAG